MMAIDRSYARSSPAVFVVGPAHHESSMDAGVLLVRCLLGVVLIADATRRLLGWFGGDGLLGRPDLATATGGYAPADFVAVVTGVAAFISGLFLLLGLLVPLAVAGATAVLLAAIGSSSADPANHLLGSDGGLRLELVVLAAVVAVALAGPGRLALDPEDISRRTRWGSVVAGAATGLAILVFRPA